MNYYDKLTPNFRYGEFWQGKIEPPKEYFNNIMIVATELQKVRDIIHMPIIITSAYRTLQHNTEIGGAKQSQHLTASAVDSHANGMNLKEYLAYLIRYTAFQGFGIGNSSIIGGNLIHSDIRKDFTVWIY